MNRNRMPNSLGRVPHQFGSIAIDDLCVSWLWGVGDVLGESEAEDVGPLLQLLGEIGVVEGGVCCAVEAVKQLQSDKIGSGGRWGKSLHLHLRIHAFEARVVASDEIAPRLGSLDVGSTGTCAVPSRSSHAGRGTRDEETSVRNTGVD